MSAVTLDGRLYMIEQEKAFKGEDAVRFLKHLMRHIPGKLLVVWDGSPIHRGRAVKDFLAGGAASRVRLEQLPGYAPELNPDEGIWKHLKCVELKNLCCQSLAELKAELRKAKERRSYMSSYAGQVDGASLVHEPVGGGEAAETTTRYRPLGLRNV
jgi:transposase